MNPRVMWKNEYLVHATSEDYDRWSAYMHVCVCVFLSAQNCCMSHDARIYRSRVYRAPFSDPYSV